MFPKWPLVLALAAGTASAQGFQFAPRVQPELRLDAVSSHNSSVLVGVGANVPAGYYLRVSASASAGTSFGTDHATTGRAEVVARWLSDPFRQMRWGAYAGGGLALVVEDDDRRRTALVIVAGVEFPGLTGWRPAVELGFGGGFRAGLVLKPVRRVGR